MEQMNNAPANVDGGQVATSQRAGQIVRQVSDLLDELAAMNFGELAGPDRVRFTSDLGRQATRLGALRDVAVASLARDSAWEGSGSRTLPDFVRRESKSSSREASKVVRRAKALEEDLPSFRAAFTAGQIDSEKIEIVSRYTEDPQLREKLRDPKEGEAHLLQLAKAKNADVFRKSVRAWAMKKSPKIAEEKHRAAVREERVTLIPEEDGFAIRGWLTSLNGEIVNTALSAMMGVPTQGDPRQPTERRAAALVELAREHLDGGRSNRAAAVRPHLSVHVPFEILQRVAPAPEALTAAGCPCGPDAGTSAGAVAADAAKTGQDATDGGHSKFQEGREGFRGGHIAGCIHEVEEERRRAGKILSVIRAGVDEDLLTGSPPATLDDGTPINYSELQTLMCSGELQRIVLSAKGEVLDVGRRYRTATTHQARAVIARDRTCRYPDCDRTIGSSEIHHADYWSAGGKTDIDNLVMLCWHHHTVVHREKMTITHHSDGWVFSSPSGYMGTTWHGHGLPTDDPRDDSGAPPRLRRSA